MAAPTFLLTILTPEQEFYNGRAEMLILPAPDGEVGILPNHQPMIFSISAGELRIKIDGKWRNAACSAGFVTVLKDEVLAVLQTAEWPEEIDIRRAERAEREAQERLRQRQSLLEYRQATAMLARARARLRVSGHYKTE